MKLFTLFLMLPLVVNFAFADADAIVELWPGDVPGQEDAKAEYEISDNRERNVLRVSKVTNPLLEVFIPENPNGAGVIISPGGGYWILAIDLEGWEIAEWLNDAGYTAFVLHYRVPENRDGAFQDVQRAVRTVRARADEWGLQRDKIGVMGFSAGGHLSSRIATAYDEVAYEPIDSIDAVSARPDFAGLIYAAWFDKGPNGTLSEEITINADTPPVFISGAFDDRRFVNGWMVLGAALSKHEVPFEMLIYQEGGHGYGSRPGNYAGELWGPEFVRWLDKNILPE